MERVRKRKLETNCYQMSGRVLAWPLTSLLISRKKHKYSNLIFLIFKWFLLFLQLHEKTLRKGVEKQEHSPCAPVYEDGIKRVIRSIPLSLATVFPHDVAPCYWPDEKRTWVINCIFSSLQKYALGYSYDRKLVYYRNKLMWTHKNAETMCLCINLANSPWRNL